MLADNLVSPYLENSFRTMLQICLEIAERDGLALDCDDCGRRRICKQLERNHRRFQKKQFFLAAAQRH